VGVLGCGSGGVWQGRGVIKGGARNSLVFGIAKDLGSSAGIDPLHKRQYQQRQVYHAAKRKKKRTPPTRSSVHWAASPAACLRAVLAIWMA